MPPARRCRLPAALGFATLTAAAAAAVTPIPAAAQDVFPGRDRIAELLHQKDEADAVPPEDVVRFAIRGNDLAVYSDVKGDVGGVRDVRLRGLPGTTRVQVGTRFRGPMGLSPFFELNHMAFSDADGSITKQLRVYAQGGSVRLERSARVGEGTTN